MSEISYNMKRYSELSNEINNINKEIIEKLTNNSITINQFPKYIKEISDVTYQMEQNKQEPEKFIDECIEALLSNESLEDRYFLNVAKEDINTTVYLSILKQELNSEQLSNIFKSINKLQMNSDKAFVGLNYLKLQIIYNDNFTDFDTVLDSENINLLTLQSIHEILMIMDSKNIILTPYNIKIIENRIGAIQQLDKDYLTKIVKGMTAEDHIKSDIQKIVDSHNVVNPDEIPVWELN